MSEQKKRLGKYWWIACIRILLMLGIAVLVSTFQVRAEEEIVEPENNSSAVAVTFAMPQEATEEISLEVKNEKGDVLIPVEEYVYMLIPNEKYTYIATEKNYYHTTAEFTAAEDLVVVVAKPETEEALLGLALYDSVYASSRETFLSAEEFSPEVHDYTCTVSDENSMATIQATAGEGYTATVCYKKQSVTATQHGNYTETIITQEVDNSKKAQTLKHFLASCGYQQQFTVRASKEAEGVTWYQDYEISLVRSLHLNDLSIESDGKELFFVDEEGEVVRFDSETQDCYTEVSKEIQSITLKGTFVNKKTTTAICGGYSLEVQGQTYDSLDGIEIPLTENAHQTIEIVVKHLDEKSIPYTYRIHVKKQKAVAVQFVTTPKDAIVSVLHQQTNKRIYANKQGEYFLQPNQKYTYTVTCNGYVAEQVKDYETPAQNQEVEITLKKAQNNTAIDNTIIAQWSSFRNFMDNNCVTDVKTPIESENAVLYWATKLGEGYGSKATGCPIIVDGYVYVYGGKTLYKIDTINGEIVATGEMAETSSFAVNPPTYAEGMIFIGLQEGRIQAFNAKTLESLWVFQDERGGQPNCPITYYDGYIYTGFWNGENQEANYVCVSVTDENPTEKTEQKLSSWTHTQKGGFYWAGAYVCENYMLIGTDDGDSGYVTGYGHIISLNPKSGEVIEDVKLPFAGDVRSNMTLYEGKFYFTSKGGYFYELKVNGDGTIQEDGMRYIKLENGSDNAENPAMSTSTPTIYNGRAYVGVSGISQFGAYAGHNITVLDLEKWEIAYRVPTQGYPQTSGLLTTAYEKENQMVYIYFFDNYTPGKLRIIADKPGQTTVLLCTEEVYREAGQEKVCKAGKVLFTPTGNHAQYALCSPIVDEYGTIYFKNDSAYLMAVGNTIEKIQVVRKPDKLRYQVGESFDAAGMKVLATYSNGMTKDVTEYVTFSKEPLTFEDDDLSIQFNHVLYQDKNGEKGVDCQKLMTSLQIIVQNLTKVPMQPAIFYKDGNIAYWKDAKTGNYYADAEGKTEIQWNDLVIPKISKAELVAVKYTYNGKVHTPEMIVKDNNGASLKAGTDYIVSYDKGRKNVGRYKVKITCKGNYTGSKTLYFYINPPKTKLTKVKAGKQKLVISWQKKTRQVTGYELQYAISKNLKNARTVTLKKNTVTKKSMNGLKAKKKYYVRIRTYKTVKINGKKKKLYSAWSSVQSKKVK